ATADGTATAGFDYTTTAGQLSFAPGITTGVVSVPVLGDLTGEPTETFTVTLSGAVGAVIANAQGIGTIIDNDLPSITIGDVTVSEGNSGVTTATVTVSLSSASTQTVTVAYATSDGTATGGSDYVTTSGTLTFSPGVTSRQIAVTINGDTQVEPN